MYMLCIEEFILQMVATFVKIDLVAKHTMEQVSAKALKSVIE